MGSTEPSDGSADIELIDAVLDHVAVAAERVAEVWPRYVGELAGEWLGGGESIGFYSAQVIYSNGMKLEGLEPRRVHENDFLRRFLDHSGPGPHHLTFKVPDITRAIAAAGAAGYPPVSVNVDDPEWKEAFLHPKAACGIVVQLAEDHGQWERQARPADLPPPRTLEPSRLDHVAHAVADLGAARRLFEHLLGGRVGEAGTDEDTEWVDLTWDSGGVVRLVAPTKDGPAAAWIAGRPGRLHHLAFTTTRPEELTGACPGPGGSLEIPPDANHGMRLRLNPA